MPCPISNYSLVITLELDTRGGELGDEFDSNSCRRRGTSSLCVLRVRGFRERYGRMLDNVDGVLCEQPSNDACACAEQRPSWAPTAAIKLKNEVDCVYVRGGTTVPVEVVR